MQENQELPKGWVWTTVGQLGAISGGVTKNSKRTQAELKLPYLRVANVQANQLQLDEVEIIGVAEGELQRVLLEKGDLLIVEGNRSPDQIGRLAIWNGSISPCLHQNHLIKARLHLPYQGPYVVNWLLSKEGKDYIRAVASSTSGLYTLSISKIAALPIPLAPLPEQHRIVSKLEELFSRLDAGVSALRQTQAQLKRYRQSVLHAAVTGELTRAWRAAQSTPPESGAALLQRIRQERRAQWEAAQTSKRGGQLLLSDSWKSKYEGPAAPDTSELPKLPSGWVWASLGELMTGILAGKSFTCLETPPQADEYGLVKISAVTWGTFNPQASKTITDPDKINLDYLIGKGDFLFSRANTLELVGACVLVQEAPKNLMLSDKVLRFDFVDIANKSLVLHTLRSQLGRRQIESSSTGNQLSMRNISQDGIYKIAVPLPPLAEQDEIVAEVERRLSVLDNLERTLSAELTRAERLRQSILHRAFTGHLVPQDAADEPAAALLARLREAPAGAVLAKAKRGRQPKAAQTTLAL